jgi:hypothetical protein
MRICVSVFDYTVFRKKTHEWKFLHPLDCWMRQHRACVQFVLERVNCTNLPQLLELFAKNYNFGGNPRANSKVREV